MIFKCTLCNKDFERSKRNAYMSIKKNCKPFCSKTCFNSFQTTKQQVLCKNCNKAFYKLLNQIKQSKNHFCSRSCSVTYNNKNKTKGNRRSKLEQYIELKLSEIYPNLQILYNNKEAIKSELDIYIPSLKLAFELNGIFHYEPIFGEDKLSNIQNNDNRKFQACLEQNIELCIIDTSSQKYFKESSSEKFLKIICEIINKKNN
jgi:hypothetical protein